MSDRYPYVQTFTDRLGVPRSYFRVRGMPAIRLPTDQSTAEFQIAYGAARDRARQAIQAVEEPDLAAGAPQSGVYLLLAGSTLTYIGSSTNLASRIAAHKANGRRFDQAFFIATEPHQAFALEKILIAALNPAENKAHAKHRKGRSLHKLRRVTPASPR